MTPLTNYRGTPEKVEGDIYDKDKILGGGRFDKSFVNGGFPSVPPLRETLLEVAFLTLSLESWVFSNEIWSYISATYDIYFQLTSSSIEKTRN